MEVELSEDLREVLHKAFQWSDVDGDNLISRQDLHHSSGLQRQQEIQALFQALKGPQGVSSQFITFDQFISRVMDFPFFIDQFKQDICKQPASNQKEKHQFSRHVTQLRTSQAQNDLVKLEQKIQKVIKYFSASMGVNFQQTSSAKTQNLAADLAKIADLVSQRCKFNPGKVQIKPLGKACLILSQKLGDLYVHCESQNKIMQAQMHDMTIGYEALKQQCQKLQSTNKKLYKELEILTHENQEIGQMRSEALLEKNEMKARLDIANNLENQAQGEIQNIQRVIKEKEEALLGLNQEISKLKSHSMIRQVLYKTGHQGIAKKTQERQVFRQTLPINTYKAIFQTASSGGSEDSQKIQNFQQAILRSQVEQKSKQIEKLQNRLLLAKQELKFTKRQLQNSKQETQNLVLKLNQERDLRHKFYQKKKTASEFNSTTRTLFDELKEMENEIEVEEAEIEYKKDQEEKERGVDFSLQVSFEMDEPKLVCCWMPFRQMENQTSNACLQYCIQI